MIFIPKHLRQFSSKPMFFVLFSYQSHYFFGNITASTIKRYLFLQMTANPQKRDDFER